jgi:hypothetical protein
MEVDAGTNERNEEFDIGSANRLFSGFLVNLLTRAEKTQHPRITELIREESLWKVKERKDADGCGTLDFECNLRLLVTVFSFCKAL